MWAFEIIDFTFRHCALRIGQVIDLSGYTVEEKADIYESMGTNRAAFVFFFVCQPI